MRTRILVVLGVGMILTSMVAFALGAFQGKSAKTKQETSVAREIKSDPSGAQAKPGGVTYTNGQVCSVYAAGSFRDSITVPDGFSIAACQDFQQKAGGYEYQLGCASASGISFSSPHASAWGCGWK